MPSDPKVQCRTGDADKGSGPGGRRAYATLRSKGSVRNGNVTEHTPRGSLGTERTGGRSRLARGNSRGQEERERREGGKGNAALWSSEGLCCLYI